MKNVRNLYMIKFLLSLVFCAGLLVLNAACSEEKNNREDEVYILPEGYIGSFYVIFNVKEGKQRKDSESGGRVYDIPETGVLLTQMDLNSGWIDTDKIKFYYRKKNSELQEITNRWTNSLEDTPEHRADASITIFGGGTGSFQRTTTSCPISHKSFHIGTKKDILDMVNHFDISEIPQLSKITCK